MMEKQQVKISPSEYIVRKILLWSIIEHVNAPLFFQSNVNAEHAKHLFMVIAGPNGQINGAEWNESELKSTPTEDLMGIYMSMERAQPTPAQAAAPKASPGGIIL